MVATFEARGATSREKALTLEQLGVSRGVILRRLRERAVIREGAHEHFYLDRESWNAVRRGRRRAVHVIGVILLALLLALLFGTRKARAEAIPPSGITPDLVSGASEHRGLEDQGNRALKFF